MFVAGVGTDVGKTHVTAGLVRALRAAGRPAWAIKPLASGFDLEDWADSDPGRLLAALGRPLRLAELDRICPWRYAAPLAPDMAAAREGRAVELEAMFDFCRREIAADPHRLLLIEGVGGVMSPVAPLATNLDWIRALGLPVLLVGGSYLGSISHMLTALETLKAAGVPVAGRVVSESQAAGTPFDETLDSLARLAGAPFFPVRRDADFAAWAPAILRGLGVFDTDPDRMETA